MDDQAKRDGEPRPDLGPNVTVKTTKHFRYGRNRAEHRAAVREMRAEMKRRKKQRAEADAARKEGTFKPGPGF